MTGNRLRSTTRRDMLRFAVALVVLTVLTAAFALAAFIRTHSTADTVRGDTAPAVIEVASARAALAEADRAAMTSFSTGAVRLSGPGDDYRDQIAIAGQHLTRAAAHDAGEGSSQQTLELVNTLLAAYSSSIEQAAASFRHNETTPLWTGDLWTASRLLHADGGALDLLDELRDAQVSKLDSEVGSGANTVLTKLSWLVPATALLVLLVIAHVYSSRRFRRTINLGLASAFLFVLVMIAVTALTFVTSSRLDATRDTVHQLRDTWHQQVSARDIRAHQILADLIDTRCASAAGECGSTVQQVVVAVRSAGPIDADEETLTDGSETIDGIAAAAAEYSGFLFVIPLAAVAALAAIAVGLYMRVAEYRYRAR